MKEVVIERARAATAIISYYCCCSAYVRRAIIAAMDSVDLRRFPGEFLDMFGFKDSAFDRIGCLSGIAMRKRHIVDDTHGLQLLHALQPAKANRIAYDRL